MSKKVRKRKILRLKRPYVNNAYKFMFEPNYIPKKYNVIYGGTGSSKSFSIMELFAEMCISNSTFDILIVRKYATTLFDTVERPFIEMLSKNFYNAETGQGLQEGRDYKYNKNQKYIQFASGSIVRFKGYDNPEKLKGIDSVNVLWLEELTDFSKDDLDEIQDRLRATPPPNHKWGKELKIFCSFNPIFKTHWVREYFFKSEIDTSTEIHKDFVKDNRTTFALKTTWRDNEFYNGQYKNPLLREKARQGNKRKYDVQSNGNWGILGELIYENFTIKEISRNVFDYDDYSYGLDFGFVHVTAGYLTAIKDNDIYILKELYKPKLTALEIAKEIKRIFGDKLRRPFICDNARPEAIKELNQNGVIAIACKKGANSVLEGIEWLQDRRIFIHPSCRGFIEEIQMYQWKKDRRTGERLPEPIKENDDAMDAVRYSTQPFKNKSSFEYAR